MKIGVIADVQYADHDDCKSFDGLATRHYRNGMRIVENAVRQWKEAGVEIVIQLGDMVDEKNNRTDDQSKEIAFRKIIETVEKQFPLKHVIGNHDLYNFNKRELMQLFEMTSSSYYDFVPCKGWRIIVLDGYDISLINQEDEKIREIAETILDANNPNPWREPGQDFRAGLVGPQQRFVPFNGGFSKTQLEWVTQRLNMAHDNQETVIFFSHLPIHPEAELPHNRYVCVPWNYEDMLSVFETSKAKIIAVFAGHDHDGGFFKDPQTNITHITLPGAVEFDQSSCHATIELCTSPNQQLNFTLSMDNYDRVKAFMEPTMTLLL